MTVIMKKYLILLIITGMSLAFGTSCSFLEDYLDKAPESGLTEDIVFTKYANFKLFFDGVYDGRKYYNNRWRNTWNYKCTVPLWMDLWDQKYCLNSTTDAMDQGRYMEGQAWKSGNMSETIVSKLCYDGSRRPVLGACLDHIRRVNIAIRNIDQVQDASQDVLDDFMGQAYFFRAWFHWTLFRLWGPFPYLDYVMGPYDETWDLERLPKHEYLMRIVSDYDSAYYFFNKAGKIRRDPVGSLDYAAYEMYRPNGMAAKALKARALLYAASPLNNKNGAADWQAAAAANWEAILIAEANGVELLPLTDPSGNDRHYNFYDREVCEESIWTLTLGNLAWNWGSGSGQVATMWGGHFMANNSASGMMPTQQWVDKYETADGYPLNTDADRAAATTAGSYNEQQPFLNRDPRFYVDITYNGSYAPGWGGGTEGAANTAWMYYDETTPTTLVNTAQYRGVTLTGYQMRKYWALNSRYNQGVRTYWSIAIVRLSELYLNYAEAAFEAYGINGAPSGATLTALQAINVIRAKSGMPNLQDAPTWQATPAYFRDRIWNERNVELSFENQHYYDDVRRWEILPQVMGSTLIGMIPQKVDVSPEYPDGFQYVRTPLPADRQPAWEEGMYYLPFLNADALKMSNFVANPVW